MYNVKNILKDHPKSTISLKKDVFNKHYPPETPKFSLLRFMARRNYLAGIEAAVLPIAPGGKLDDIQLTSIAKINDNFERHGDGDIRKLAYIYSTTRHESFIRPVRECFGKTDQESRDCVRRNGRDYAKVINGHVYYGRGFVQLTWDFNYKSMSKRLGMSRRLLDNPDLALDIDIAAKILVIGMMEGLFTGRKLGGYINAKTDFVNARQIVNGFVKDKKVAIAIAKDAEIVLSKLKKLTD